MSEVRSLLTWKTAPAVGVGVTAVAGLAAGIAVVAYKVLSRKNGGPETEQETPISAHQRAMKMKQEGNGLYKAQKYSEAAECYNLALELCPLEEKDDIVKLYQNVGAAYIEMASQATDQDKKSEYFTLVVDYCSRAYHLNQHDVEAITLRLKAYEALGRRQDALLDMTRIVVLDESQATVVGEAITILLKELGKEKAAIEFASLGPLAPTNYVIKSYLEKFVWNDDLSEERLKDLWDSQKQDLEGSEGEPRQFSEEPFLKATAMFRKQQYDGIIEALSEAIEKGCQVFRPHALLLRGTFYITWRDSRKALMDLDAVIGMAGVSKMLMINVLIKKATIYASIPDVVKMKECFDHCFQLDKTCPDALIRKAWILLESPEGTESMKGVVKDLKKATILAPQSAFALFSLATAYHRVAKMMQSKLILIKAVSTFKEAFIKFPEYGDGLVLFAMFLLDCSKVSKVEQMLTRVAKAEPDNPSVHLSLGMIALPFSEREKVKAHLQKAIEVDNSCVQAYDTLAMLELQEGNAKGALDLYSTAARFARFQSELSQILAAKEMISAQHQVCQEYGISIKDFTAHAQPSEHGT